MNKLAPLFLVFSCLSILGCNSPSKEVQQATNTHQPETANLDAYFTALAQLKKFNGAVLVQNDEEVILFKAYNIYEDVGHSMHVGTNSQFDIHSISKLMAKACVVKLEKEGLLSSTDVVSDYLPDFPQGEKISLQHLLDNQSGLPRDFAFEVENLIDKSPDELIELIKKEELLFQPGSDALYSNLGYQLVYYIISRVAEKPFVQFVQDEFFEPLGMNHSGAHFYSEKDNLTHPVVNHVEDEGHIVAVPNWEHTAKNQAKIYSTLSDLLKFIQAMKKEPYRSALVNNNGHIGWSGGGDGILSHAESNLSSGYEFVFFSNYDEIPFGGILEDVAKIMTNKPFVLPREINRKAIQLDRDVLERYVGKYDMAEFNHDEFEIRLERDSIAFYQNGEFGGMLQAENDTTLFGDPRDEDYFIFRLDEGENYILVYKYKGVDIVGVRK